MIRSMQVWCVVLVVTGCGSRTEYGVVVTSASRSADDRVVVTGRVTGSQFGSDDVASEVCVRVSWFESLSAASDAGTDGGEVMRDGGAEADAGVTRATGGFIAIDVNERVGAQLTTIEACPNTGNPFEVTSPQPIPAGRRIIMSLMPFESAASMARAPSSRGNILMRGTAIVSP